MERIKSLGIYQKVILVLLILLVIAFSIIYPIRLGKLGLEYNESILVPSEENGNTIYSGKIQGVPASFTIFPDKTVVFKYGEKIYGPYYIKEDPSAIAKDIPTSFPYTENIGFELYCGDEMIFRGCKVIVGSSFLLFDETGRGAIDIKIVPEYGTIATDENGNEIDQMEPTVSDILKIMDGPELTHKGHGIVWFGGVVICVVTALSILFADELFRWHISFRVADPDNVEPADWEIISRYISWTLLPILAAIVFIMGLY